MTASDLRRQVFAYLRASVLLHFAGRHHAAESARKLARTYRDRLYAMRGQA